MLTAEKVKHEELIFITPKGKRIKAFEELRKPKNKHDCQEVFSGMLLSLSKWNSTVALEIPLISKGTAAKGKFIWTNEMEKEYNTVRNTILEQISLTPVDERKTLRPIIDSVPAGLEGVFADLKIEMSDGGDGRPV